MAFALWSVLIGLLLILLALGASVLARLPLSTAMLYLVVGLAVSPLGLAWSDFGPLTHTTLLERLTEVVVLVSLFSAGLKLGHGIGDRRWLLPLRLASVSMLVTVGCITFAGWALLGLPPLLLHAYGFLAVFAAGVALRNLVQRQSGSAEASRRAVEQAAAVPDRRVADTMAVDPQ
ncbi:MAG: hypothetical protein ACXWC6_17760, partial [Ramlibacter sp.]